MILVIDNYDSFTFNLVHYLLELGAEVEVVRNDALSAGQAISSGAQGFLISPGPCTPNEAGISLDLVGAAADAGKPCWACAWAIRRSGSISAARWCAAG
jgi:anthranilate synthase component 2